MWDKVHERADPLVVYRRNVEKLARFVAHHGMRSQPLPNAVADSTLALYYPASHGAAAGHLPYPVIDVLVAFCDCGNPAFKRYALKTHNWGAGQLRAYHGFILFSVHRYNPPSQIPIPSTSPTLTSSLRRSLEAARFRVRVSGHALAGAHICERSELMCGSSRVAVALGRCNIWATHRLTRGKHRQPLDHQT